MVTFITKKDGKIDRICQTHEDESPGPEWEKVPNDWGGNHGDRLEWFNAGMRRVPDAELVEHGVRKDCRGTWYNKDTGAAKTVYNLDEEPDETWTKARPIGNEPYQKWDEAAGSWAVDAEAKEAAEKERRIAEKKGAIQNAEQRIQRSLIAIQSGTATEDDEQYFAQISAEIVLLREELRQLVAA
jgi:hypothetical protein